MNYKNNFFNLKKIDITLKKLILLKNHNLLTFHSPYVEMFYNGRKLFRSQTKSSSGLYIEFNEDYEIDEEDMKSPNEFVFKVMNA